MALIHVNPTRMELTRLKKRLVMARRGHKLLKDKRDELMKQFLDMIRRNRELRIKVEKLLVKAYGDFEIARAVMSANVMNESLMFPKQKMEVDVSTRNIMSVNVPVMEFNLESDNESSIYPYGFAETSAQLDDSIESLYKVLPEMLELGVIEKSVQLLAAEIEKTRRRVNALEYVIIPQLNETTRYITMKLDENERGNLTRLMKVKDMMIEQVRKNALNESS
ncbi:MAG: V-type ATP synthase subunit D [Eubacteriales bacterium]|nr:V-type ATP synthase subunit D [Eubacteriales bacterium]